MFFLYCYFDILFYIGILFSLFKTLQSTFKMFLCSSFSTAGHSMKTAFGCVCLLLVAGPVLLITGIVTLVSPNARSDNVRTFNTAVATFDSSILNGWAVGSTVNYTAGTSAVTVPMSLSTNYIRIAGNPAGVSNGTSTLLRGSSANLNVVLLQYNVPNLQTLSKVVIPSRLQSQLIPCGCTASGCICSILSLDSSCKQLYGSSSSYSGTQCGQMQTCGACQYSEYLSQFCSVVDSNSGGPFTGSMVYQSCFYPFSQTSQKYVPLQGNWTIELRVSTDPYLVLERLTGGSQDFGLTSYQQLAIGAGLVVAGTVLLFCVFGSIYFIVKALSGGNPTAPPQPTQMQYLPQGQPSYPTNPQTYTYPPAREPFGNYPSSVPQYKA